MSRDSRNAREAVKPHIKTEDPLHPVLLHDGQMNCIARGHPRVSHHDFFGAFRRRSIDLENILDHAK